MVILLGLMLLFKDPPSQSCNVDPLSCDLVDKSIILDEFFKRCKDRSPSSSIAFVAHTCTSFVGLTQSLSIGPWVLDLGATYHITGNKSLFSSLFYLDNLPSMFVLILLFFECTISLIRWTIHESCLGCAPT